MITQGRRCLAALLTIGALGIVPQAANADELDTIAEQLYHVQGLTYSFDGTPADVFTLVFSSREREANRQSVSGIFNGASFAGVLYDHTYDRQQDVGHYTLIGTANGPEGLPVPVVAIVNAKVDRTRENYQLEVGGTIGSTPISGVSQSLTNPLYGAA